MIVSFEICHLWEAISMVHSSKNVFPSTLGSCRFKSVNDLPTPRDPKIKFNVHKEAVMAVIGPFGGFPGDFDYETKFSQLKKYLGKDGLKYDESSAVFAGYSSPFEIRNRNQEVHVKIVS
jgi:hypothetical protein